jgi:hypothetical protein
VRGDTDLLAAPRIESPQRIRREIKRVARGCWSEVQCGCQRHLVAVHLSGQEVLRRASLAFGHPVELGDHRCLREPEIERREALRWIPTTALEASPGPRERVPILRDMAECLSRERGRLEGINPGQELTVEHPRA